MSPLVIDGPALEAHRAAVRAYLRRRCGNDQDAEDLTQETLIRGWEAREQFRGPHLDRWLRGIAYRQYLDHLRRAKQLCLPLLEEHLPSAAPEWEPQRRVDSLTAHLGLIHPVYRQVLWLHACGWGFRQIGTRTGETWVAVFNRFRRGVRALRAVAKEVP